mmetsp:Transcript_21531/g.31756  ORF Transcript_21531/g.31756 Transcript_21531/m.31756 type:complete len:474 (-) Transcript_21531:1024-2445(-)
MRRTVTAIPVTCFFNSFAALAALLSPIFPVALALSPSASTSPLSSKLSMNKHSSISSGPIVELTHRQNDIQNPGSSTGTGGRNIAPPTLFLHGLDSSSHTWRSTLLELEEHTSNNPKDNESTCACPAVALDLRGCGKSPLGDPEEFCPSAIVNDIHNFVSRHPYFCDDIDADENGNDNDNGSRNGNPIIKPFVLVGHGMGGRIAMSFASTYPYLVKALVIEDMDIRTRPMHMNIFQSKGGDSGSDEEKMLLRDKTIAFERNINIQLQSEFETISEQEGVKMMERATEALAQIYSQEGYPSNSVGKWLKEGRVTFQGTHMHTNNENKKMHNFQYYSEVNPAFRLLCYEQFFLTNHGEDTWRDLAVLTSTISAGNDTNQHHDFPIHVMVADQEKTVCDEESIWCMKKIMKKGQIGRTGMGKHEDVDVDVDDTSTDTGLGRFMVMHRYKGATHSIHNSASKEFMNDLRRIIRTASL